VSRAGDANTGAPYAPRGDWTRLPVECRVVALAAAQRVLGGEYLAFGDRWLLLPTTPFGWRTHPSTAHEFDQGPWWRIRHLTHGVDIKEVWEPSRFTWVYDLIRGHALTGDEQHGTVFHAMLASWMEANPPFRGVNWSCGQETAIRLLAILHAEAALPAPAAAGDARRRVDEVVAWSGERIYDAIGYGLSQRNNHGISESAGLLHAGARLLGAHADATRWLRRGRVLLEEQLRDQFSVDGWYAQHSFTYMRLALEHTLLAQRVLRSRGESLSVESLALLRAAFELLLLIVDGETGVVPNHGANDGGRAIAYSSAPYRDFRPLLTLAATTLDLPLPSDVSPDPEVEAWLGERPRIARPRGDIAASGASGWVVARISDVSVFAYAGQYRHRPSHMDQLHLDVRFGSQEVITDPGTFAYNASDPWRNGLAGAGVHNAPVLDNREPARRGPRFLWYEWPCARVVHATCERTEAIIALEVPNCLRREVRVTPARVRVMDRVLASWPAVAQVTWLLHPDVRSPACVTSTGATAIGAREADVTAWFSPAYGRRIRSTAVRVRRDVAEHREIETTIEAPGQQDEAAT
jgi:hypothetical protein